MRRSSSSSIIVAKGAATKARLVVWTLDTWIDDVAAFCDVLGIERPIILGQSFGGMVGLGVAIRYPELPARLVVSSSLARFRVERALAMFEELGGEKARAVAARFFRNPNREELRRLYGHLLSALWSGAPRSGCAGTRTVPAGGEFPLLRRRAQDLRLVRRPQPDPLPDVDPGRRSRPDRNRS